MPFCETEDDHYYHDRLGTNTGKAQEKDVFFAGRKVKKLLLVNKGNETTAPIGFEASFQCVESIDGRTPWQAPTRLALGPSDRTLTLHSFGVAILTETPCS
jgi:hypothetical protein